MRPPGEIQLALVQAWSEGHAPVREAAQRAQVGMAAAKYTATRMVRRGDLVVVKPGRPAVLGLAAQGAAPRDSRAAEPAFDALLSWLRMGVAAG